MMAVFIAFHRSLMRARYSAGNPVLRSQSLAKITALESSSHTGEVLLHRPEVNSRTAPLWLFFSRSCSHPLSGDSQTVHVPSGDTKDSAREGTGIPNACVAI
jgi:hypothetical protein